MDDANAADLNISLLRLGHPAHEGEGDAAHGHEEEADRDPEAEVCQERQVGGEVSNEAGAEESGERETQAVTREFDVVFEHLVSRLPGQEGGGFGKLKGPDMFPSESCDTFGVR